MNARPEGKTKIIFLIFAPACSSTFAREILSENSQDFSTNGSETTST